MTHVRKTLKILAATALVASLCAVPSQGQQSGAGIAPFTAHDFGADDSVNLGNLNVTIPITLYQRQERGANPEIDKLVYDNPQWTCVEGAGADPDGCQEEITGGGWREAYQTNYTNLQNCGGPVGYAQPGYAYFEDSLGATHTFMGGGPTSSGFIANSPYMLGAASDNSGYELWEELYGSDQPGGPGGYISCWVTDKNGNQGQEDRNGNVQTYLLSRTPYPQPSAPAGTIGYGFFVNSTTSYPTASGTQHYTINASVHTVGSNYATYTYQMWLIDSIQLANNTSYSFTYDLFGRMSKMVTPKGATYTYQWTNSAAGPEISLTRTVNGAATTYNIATEQIGNGNTLQWPVGPTTVVDPDGVTSVHQTNPDGYESTVNTGIQTVSTCVTYNAAAPSPQFCSSPSDPGPSTSAMNMTRSTTTTNTEDGSTSSKITNTDAIGDLIDTKYYDYGNGNVNSPDREDVNTYDVSTVPVELTEAKIYDHGTLIQDKTFTYDETALQTSGASGLATPTQRRANVTTTSQWVAGNTWINTHTSYYDTGSAYQSTDGRGITSSQLAYNATTGCNFAFPIQDVTPAGTSSSTWDCDSGQTASSTDIRGITTTYSSTDPFGRTTGSVRSADGATTTVSYDDTDNRVETWKRVLSSSGTTPDGTWTDHIDQYDSLGQLTRSMDNHTGSSGPWTVTDTSYTPGNRQSNSPLPQFVSEITASSTSGSGAQVSYDSYGRPYKSAFSAPSGGASAAQLTTFHGSIQKVTDEAGSSKLMQRNSFGRLVAVCELVSDGTGNPCGMGVSGSGYKTVYSYDVLGNLKSVNQQGGNTTVSGGSLVADTPRTRTFVYDGLSRLLSAYNPEDGGICYGHGVYPNCQNDGYDGNGNLLYKTDANGTTIAYTYDSANRMLTKTSSGDSFTNFQYTYGSSGSSNGLLVQEADIWTGPTIVNWETELINGSPVSGTQFNYDAVGNISSTSWWNYMEAAWQPGMTNLNHDLLGDLTQQTYPDGTVVSNTWDNGGWNSLTYFGTSWTVGNYQISKNVFDAAGRVSSAEYVYDWENSGGVAAGYTIYENARQQNCGIDIWDPTWSSLLLGRNIYYGSTPEAQCGFASDDNGNVHSLQDVQWAYSDSTDTTYMSQGFTYDSLNRLTSAYSANYPPSSPYNFSYQYDAFGNMLPVDQNHSPMNYGRDPSPTNRLTLNGDVNNGDLRYNANGSLAVANGAGGDFGISYTAEGYLRCINDCNMGSYLYNGMGQRSFAFRNNQFWLEPVYLNGQPMTNLDSDGAWTDLIYSAGRKVGRVRSQEPVLHFQGNQGSSSGCTEHAYGQISTGPAGYTISGSDSLAFDFRQNVNTDGGLVFVFTQQGWWGSARSDDSTDGTEMADEITGESVSDITSAASTWQHFVAPLWQYDGMTVQSLNARFSNSMSVGAFDMQIANAVIIHGDGTVTPLINSTTTVETLSNVCSATSITSGVIATPVDPSEGIHYFIPDQVGTTIYEFGPGGWPVWHGAYTPFGQEIVNGFEQNVVGTETADGTYNRYKFTGKERDTESGLDYFGARYYSSSMGRWISPDWSDPAQPVPYASLDRPQTLNLYSYGINNPVSSVDDDGHSTLTYDGKAQTITLRESDGTVTTFQASNNPQLSLSIGKLVDGNYEFLDTQRPHLHDDPKDDTRNGPYGSYGIFRLKPFKGADGKQHDGVGLHSGRADSTDKAGRSGYCYATNGCVRTSDFAMWYFSLIAPFDPLTTLTVQNNRPDPADDHGDHPDPNPDPGPKPPPHLIPRQNRGDDED